MDQDKSRSLATFLSDLDIVVAALRDLVVNHPTEFVATYRQLLIEEVRTHGISTNEARDRVDKILGKLGLTQLEDRDISNPIFDPSHVRIQVDRSELDLLLNEKQSFDVEYFRPRNVGVRMRGVFPIMDGDMIVFSHPAPQFIDNSEDRAFFSIAPSSSP